MNGKISKEKVSLWDYTELCITAGFGGNPFSEVDFTALFTSEGKSVTVQGFYDGKDEWKIRFMPPSEGRWHYRTSSNLPALDGSEGEILCEGREEGNHGMVQVADKIHFAYSDGTPYYPVGTTCYVWNLQGPELEEKTLRSLESSPFNKIRFCVYPKRYTFNHNEPPLYPFKGEINRTWTREEQDDYTPKPRDFWDFDELNPDYFRHIDECVLALRDRNIEADLILFHPYDFGAWGFDCIPENKNRVILKYLVARLGAFRNIWWSFANEFDLFQNKALHEWHRYIQLVQELDPYGHLRSIHNCREFYDHHKPWITHCSIQSDRFDLIKGWLEEYEKPVVIDECGYEGNIDRDWGNLSPREMVHRFWSGFCQGGYVGHGETYMHPEDTLWWSKGGTLHGESPERIGFLRQIIEGFPTKHSAPFERHNAFMDGKGYGVYPEFGLYYLGVRQPSFREVTLPEEGAWEIDVIDTWNMTVQSLGRDFSGQCRIDLPGRDGMAVRFRKRD